MVPPLGVDATWCQLQLVASEQQLCAALKQQQQSQCQLHQSHRQQHRQPGFSFWQAAAQQAPTDWLPQLLHKMLEHSTPPNTRSTMEGPGSLGSRSGTSSEALATAPEPPGLAANSCCTAALPAASSPDGAEAAVGVPSGDAAADPLPAAAAAAAAAVGVPAVGVPGIEEEGDLLRAPDRLRSMSSALFCSVCRPSSR